MKSLSERQVATDAMRSSLTGTITSPNDLSDKDTRTQRYPRFTGEAFDKNRIIVEWVRIIAEQGTDIVPIPGTTRRKYLEENARAAQIVLTSNEIAKLEAAVPQDEVIGDRYLAAAMKTIERS